MITLGKVIDVLYAITVQWHVQKVKMIHHILNDNLYCITRYHSHPYSQCCCLSFCLSPPSPLSLFLYLCLNLSFSLLLSRSCLSLVNHQFLSFNQSLSLHLHLYQFIYSYSMVHNSNLILPLTPALAPTYPSLRAKS